MSGHVVVLSHFPRTQTHRNLLAPHIQVVATGSTAPTVTVSASATTGAPAMWKRECVSAATATLDRPAANGARRIATARTALGCASARMAHAATSAPGSASALLATLGNFARTVSVTHVCISCINVNGGCVCGAVFQWQGRAHSTSHDKENVYLNPQK